MNVAISRKLLSYRKALFIANEQSDEGSSLEFNHDMVFAFIAEMADLGYSFSDNALQYLKSLTVGPLQEFISASRQVVQETLGADKDYVPLFRKFPESIPDRTLLIEIVHERLEAVSYTHLDVYKRQTLHSVNRATSAQIWWRVVLFVVSLYHCNAELPLTILYTSESFCSRTKYKSCTLQTDRYLVSSATMYSIILFWSTPQPRSGRLLASIY